MYNENYNILYSLLKISHNSALSSSTNYTH